MPCLSILQRSLVSNKSDMNITRHIPNSITSMNLLCGALGVIAAFKGSLDTAYLRRRLVQREIRSLSTIITLHSTPYTLCFTLSISILIASAPMCSPTKRVKPLSSMRVCMRSASSSVLPSISRSITYAPLPCSSRIRTPTMCAA